MIELLWIYRGTNISFLIMIIFILEQYICSIFINDLNLLCNDLIQDSLSQRHLFPFKSIIGIFLKRIYLVSFKSVFQHDKYTIDRWCKISIWDNTYDIKCTWASLNEIWIPLFVGYHWMKCYVLCSVTCMIRYIS